MLIKIFSCVWNWKHHNSKNLFLKSHWKQIVVRRCFQIEFLLDSGCALAIWMTWPLNRYWGGLTLFSLPLIAHAICTGMHHHGSDWQGMKLPNSCSGKHVCTWDVCAEPLISVWKVYNYKRYCETRFTNPITNKMFLASENALRHWKEPLCRPPVCKHVSQNTCWESQWPVNQGRMVMHAKPKIVGC